MYFYIYKDAKNEFRWRLSGGNGKILADSGEGYHNKADCRHAIDLIRQDAPTCMIVDITEKT